MKQKIVLAYSGGLDTSTMTKWLTEEKGYDVVTFTGDVGQKVDLKAAEEKAKKIGAVAAYTEDLKEEFALGYIFPAIKANALYEGKYPLLSSLSRPLLAKKLVEIAKKEDAVAVAHGATGKGNDQVRFEVTIHALAPDLKIIAPVREWGFTRPEQKEYCKKHGIELNEKEVKYSLDQNLWGRSIESGPLEDPEHEPDDDVYYYTCKDVDAPDEPEYVEIGFEEGVPVSVSGKNMKPVELLKKLNELGGTHGIGLIDQVESRLVGIKSREVYECPAATILIEAHKDLEKLVFTRHMVSFKSAVDQKWAELVYTGLWVEPLKDSLDAFIDYTQQFVNGTVKVKLYKGKCQVVGRKSPNSIYEYDLATYSKKGSFDQKASEGFIKLWGLQSALFKIKNKSEILVATKDDVAGIKELHDHFKKEGICLLDLTHDDIEQQKENFIVVKEGGQVIGCGRIVDYGKDLAEISTLLVDEKHQWKGYGTKIVKELVKKSKKSNFFVGTNKKYSGLFEKFGFKRFGSMKDGTEKGILKAGICSNCPKIETCVDNVFVKGEMYEKANLEN